MSNRDLIERLVLRAEKLGAAYNASNVEFENIESILRVTLSCEFKAVCRRFCYESLYLTPFYSLFGDEQESTIHETKLYRQHLQLPYRYLVLSEDDCAAIFLETQDDPEKDSPVHIVDLNDIERFIQGEKLEYGYEYFQSFTDFFQYLIEQEEGYQKESSDR